jgi:hypothetical protein
MVTILFLIQSLLYGLGQFAMFLAQPFQHFSHAGHAGDFVLGSNKGRLGGDYVKSKSPFGFLVGFFFLHSVVVLLQVPL